MDSLFWVTAPLILGFLCVTRDYDQVSLSQSLLVIRLFVGVLLTVLF